MENQQQVILVTCALIFKDQYLLAAQRNENTSLALKWELPGGKVEAGETPTQCIHRELIEELDLTVAILQQLPSYQHTYNGKKIIELIPFICRPTSTHTVLEHKEVRWLQPSKYLSVDWAEADREILLRYTQQQQQQ